MQREQPTARRQAQLDTVLPDGRPDRQLRWDAAHKERSGPGTWQGVAGTGHAQIAEEELAHDPVARVFVRWDAFENGTDQVVISTPTGQVTAKLDREEQKVLAGGKGSRSIEEANKVADTVMPLHIVLHFTDAWATDGSKMRVRKGNVKETRVACGAFGGVQPLQRNGWECV